MIYDNWIDVFSIVRKKFFILKNPIIKNEKNFENHKFENMS